MNNPFKKSKYKELSKIVGEAAELIKELEEEKKQLDMRCISLETEVNRLTKKNIELKAENKSLTAKKTELQQKLNEKRLMVAVSSHQAQKLAFENAELNAYIKNHCGEVKSNVESD